MVAGGAVVLGIAIDLAPLEGLVVALSALVGCGRRRRCRIGNCNRSGSVRGSGGCVVGSGRLWSAVVAGGAVVLEIAIDLAPVEGLVVALSALVGCGRRRRCRIVYYNRSRSGRGSGGCVVGSGRLWSAVVAGGAVVLGIAIVWWLRCRLWSAVVAGGAVFLEIATDLAPLEGLVVALSALVGCGRRRRCRIGNCNRSGSVRGSGGCVVGSGRLWSPVALSYWKSQ